MRRHWGIMGDTAKSGDCAPSDRTADGIAPIRKARSRFVRPLFDSVVSLMLAVVLFRTFEMEGYMIPTGSMAPCLLGHHKRIVCPSCRYPFAVGIAENASGLPPGRWIGTPVPDRAAEDRSQSDGTSESWLPSDSRTRAVCPNCRLRWVDTSAAASNFGDQLLVHKNAYSFRAPRRWEIAVFRNPGDPRQAYVKRIVGLPGEQVQIRDGDVYVDGRIERKDGEIQRRMRIPVYDNDYRPVDDRHWQPRWQPVPAEGAWQLVDGGFRLIDKEPGRAGEESGWGWVVYHHWIRSGGSHRTVVTLSSAAADVILPSQPLVPVRWDAAARQIACVGALPGVWRDRLIAVNPDPETRRYIRELYEESHLSPVTDQYGYNTGRGGAPPAVVRDLIFSGTVNLLGGQGQFVLQMTDGQSTFDFVIDTAAECLKLLDGGSQTLRTSPLPDDFGGRPMFVEMSLVDRQVLVAIDGRPVFEPWLLDERAEETPGPRIPVRFAAKGLSVDVAALKLYRDVHYTRGDARNGVLHPFRLGRGEYFMLGDNSPVSSDSRSWSSGAVPDRLLLGRPLVVHLPSRAGRIKIGSHVRYIRIPDISRIRYIR